jgi:uncharacterized membrane protein YfcA
MDAGTILAISFCGFWGSFSSAAAGFGGAITFLGIFAIVGAIFPVGSIKMGIAYSVWRGSLVSPYLAFASRRHIIWSLMLAMVPGLLLGDSVS